MKHPKSYDSTAETRKRMSHVKLKKGYEEVVLAKALWHKGYRYRLNYKGLPGSPDIAIITYKVAIFVDGEFWHGYKWDEKKDKIKRNREYWIQKIEENMARDSRVDEELKAMDWIPIHFWSQSIRKNIDECVQVVSDCVLEQKIRNIESRV